MATPKANKSTEELKDAEVALPALDNEQAKAKQEAELKEASEAGKTVKVMKPVKDSNGMVIDFEEVEVPVEQAKAQFVPGGLTNQARYVETNARLQ